MLCVFMCVSVIVCEGGGGGGGGGGEACSHIQSWIHWGNSCDISHASRKC